MSFISVEELALWRSGGLAFDLLDVRRAQARAADGSAIEGARWLDPALWLDWKDSIATAERRCVLVCAHGHEISQGLSAALRAMGVDARSLAGGMTAWKAAAQPVVAAGPGAGAPAPSG